MTTWRRAAGSKIYHAEGYGFVRYGYSACGRAIGIGYMSTDTTPEPHVELLSEWPRRVGKVRACKACANALHLSMCDVDSGREEV